MCDHDIELRRKRDLERYHRRTAERRAKGLCLKCGKRPPAPHRTQCEPCIEKRRPADLVGRLEELGIGRPSTYAAIVAVLRERGYAVLYRRRFVATERGRVVTAVPGAVLREVGGLRVHQGMFTIPTSLCH